MKRERLLRSLWKIIGTPMPYSTPRCIELSIKAFLQALEIAYEPKHELEVSYFEQILEKLRSKLEGWALEDARIMLPRAKVWMDLLGKIRSYAEGYTPLNVPARNLFDFRLEGLAGLQLDRSVPLTSTLRVWLGGWVY